MHEANDATFGVFSKPIIYHDFVRTLQRIPGERLWQTQNLNHGFVASNTQQMKLMYLSGVAPRQGMHLQNLFLLVCFQESSNLSLFNLVVEMSYFEFYFRRNICSNAYFRRKKSNNTFRD